MAALLAGQSVTEIARQYHINKATIIAWRRAAAADGSFLDELRPEADVRLAEIGDLVATYLREVLATVCVQAELFRDKAWLAKQPASEAAVLHGVMVDKAIRILEAIDSTAGPEPATGGPPQPPGVRP